MTIAGKFGLTATASSSGAYIHEFAHRGHGDTITVSDPYLLFAGDYKRSGPDLILSKDGREQVVENYFTGHKHATLVAPDGARLSGDIVDALTGHVQYAQAGGAPDAAKVIGHVTKLAGNATVIRNGVSIVLNMGDNVHKGDVVQSGSNSQLGITFIDGTVFGLASNARMVLNDMVYDPNGSSNSSFLSLVQGSITFLAGETAKHGDMKIGTPVATMGIRGTACMVEIDFDVQVTDPNSTVPRTIPVKFQVLREKDGTVGSYFLYALNDLTYSNPVATINQAGQVTAYSANGQFTVTQLTQIAPEIKAIIDQTLGLSSNPNPQSNPTPGSTPADPANPGTPKDTSPIKDVPVGTPTPLQIPINFPDPNHPGQTIQSVNVTVTVLKKIDITPVVDKASFAIADQVKISDDNPSDVLTPYVPGSGKVQSVTGPAYTPEGIDLKHFVTVDPSTGHVIYDPAAFAFLKAGDTAVVTIDFDTSAGSDTFHESLTITINGVNDAPVIENATIAVSQGGTVVLTAASIGVIDPDSTSFKFTVSNVTHGTFQTTADGVTWVDATTFTTADLTTGHVRFVHDGGEGAPAFSIQADDGEAASNLSNVLAGSVNFSNVNDAPVVTKAVLDVLEGGTVVLDAAAIGVADPDSASFTFTLSNVSHGTFQTTVDGNVWVDAATFTTDALNAGHVRFVHDGGEDAPAFSITADDGATSNNLSATVAGIINFTNVNDAPVMTKAVLDVTEGGTVVLDATAIGVTDPDSATFTFTVSNVSHGTFQTTADGVTWTNTVTFTTEGLNAGHVRFVHDGGENAPTFSIQAYDGADDNSSSNVFAGTVDFTNVNDAPVITAAALSVAEGGTVVLGAANIGVSDPDSTSFTFTASNVSHGTFQNSTDGVNWTDTVTFTTEDLNAGHVRFVHDGGEDAPTFSIQAYDGAGGDNFSNVLAGNVDFTNVNDAPVVTAAQLTISEGGTVVLTSADIGVTDPDSSSFVFVALDVSHGTFQTTTDGTIWDDAGIFTTDDLDAGHVRFVHDGGEDAPTFSIQAYDSAGGDNFSNVLTGTVDFTNVNDASVATAPAAHYHATEQTDLSLRNTGLSIADVDGDGGTETVTLAAGEGILTIAAGNSDISNINGNGTGAVTFSGSIAQINALLNSSTGTIVYNDNTDTPGTSTTLTLTVHDNGHTGTGGDQTGSASSTIDIAAVDDAPVIEGDHSVSVSVPENTTAVATVVADDPDGPSLTYSIIAGSGSPDASKFTIDATTGALSFVSAPDFGRPTDSDHDNVYTVEVKVSDGTLSDIQTLFVHVTDVNDNAPVITTGSSQSVVENHSFVTHLSAFDVDSVGGPTVFSIADGLDGSLFEIVHGNLQFKAAPDFEHPSDSNHNNIYSVTVNASDGLNSSVRTISVHVTNVNEAPVLAPNIADVTYVENAAPLALMSAGTVTDPDNPANFDDGSLSVTLNGAVSGDELVLAANTHVGIFGSSVKVDGVTVGTISGNHSTHLAVEFNSNATDARVETVLHALSFDSTSDNPTNADRTATVTFNDGSNDGSGPALSDSSTVTIHVTPVNDAPHAVDDVVITNNGSNSTYVIPGWALLANDNDPDSSLTVSSISYPSGFSSAVLSNGDVTIHDNSSVGGSFNYPASDGSLHDDGHVTVTQDAGTMNGGSGSEIFIGDSSGSTINANGGNDILIGNGGNDTLNGGSGNDTYVFGLHDGQDVIHDTSGLDTIRIEANGAALTGLSFAENTTHDLVVQFDGQQVTVDDHFIGDDNVGGLMFDGGASYDGYQLDAGLYYLSNDSGSNRTGSSGNDVLSGDGAANTISGGDGNDLLFGNAGNDTLNGGSGNDLLVGGAGNDFMTGGSGNDTFVFAKGSGHDTVADFTPGQDHISLDYHAFDATGPNDFSHWLASHAATIGNDVLIDLNVDGHSPGVDTILLKNVASLHAGDFIVHPVT